MTRFWWAALPVQVEVDAAEQPAVLRWARQVHRVEQVSDTWRVDTEWWDERVWRDYYAVLTHTGWLLVLYQDHLRGGWYLQRGYS